MIPLTLQHVSKVVLKSLLLLKISNHVCDVLLKFSFGFKLQYIVLWVERTIQKLGAILLNVVIDILKVFFVEILRVQVPQDSSSWIYLLRDKLQVFLTDMEWLVVCLYLVRAVASTVPLAGLDSTRQSVWLIQIECLYVTLSINLEELGDFFTWAACWCLLSHSILWLCSFYSNCQ